MVIRAEDIIADTPAPGPTARVGLATAQAIIARLNDAGFVIAGAATTDSTMARTTTPRKPKSGDA